MPKLGDSLDVPTFEQILEMDDDEDEREFSRGIVFGFFDQAKSTFTELDDCLYVILLRYHLPRIVSSIQPAVILWSLLAILTAPPQKSERPRESLKSGPLPERLIRNNRPEQDQKRL